MVDCDYFGVIGFLCDELSFGCIWQLFVVCFVIFQECVVDLFFCYGVIVECVVVFCVEKFDQLFFYFLCFMYNEIVWLIYECVVLYFDDLIFRCLQIVLDGECMLVLMCEFGYLFVDEWC